MNVYIVITDDWEDRTIEGVFSTPDAAEELARALAATGAGDFGVYVDEFVVDAPGGDQGKEDVVRYGPSPQAAGEGAGDGRDGGGDPGVRRGVGSGDGGDTGGAVGTAAAVKEAGG